MNATIKKIIVRVSVVAALAALVLVPVVFIGLEMMVRDLVGVAPDDIPDGWTDRIRQQASPPAALATFLTDERADGNAAEWVYRYREEAGDNQSYSSALGKLRRDEAFDAADSAAWNGGLDDPALDLLAQASSFDDYFSYDLVMALPENEGATNILTVEVLLHFPILRGAQGLALRARRKLASGRRREALDELRRVFALGDLMLRGEFQRYGYLMGRNILRLAAQEAENYGAVTGDQNISAAAGEITRWYEETSRSGLLFEPMVTMRDSAIALAGEESLALAWRAEALASLVLGQYRPYRIWGGIEPEVREAVVEFVNDPDSQLAARASFIVDSMDRFDEMGVLGRWKFIYDAFSR